MRVYRLIDLYRMLKEAKGDFCYVSAFGMKYVVDMTAHIKWGRLPDGPHSGITPIEPVKFTKDLPVQVTKVVEKKREVTRLTDFVPEYVPKTKGMESIKIKTIRERK